LAASHWSVRRFSRCVSAPSSRPARLWGARGGAVCVPCAPWPRLVCFCLVPRSGSRRWENSIRGCCILPPRFGSSPAIRRCCQGRGLRCFRGSSRVQPEVVLSRGGCNTRAAAGRSTVGRWVGSIASLEARRATTSGGRPTRATPARYALSTTVRGLRPTRVGVLPNVHRQRARSSGAGVRPLWRAPAV
jgi:hypothetical protein